METKVVNIPFVGGINEFNDPDQLQPPELITCEEAVFRKPGRIEKRHGFALVEGVTGAPATAFDGDSVPDHAVEAIEAYYGENGARAVMAAGKKLYEYVGHGSSRGWRKVNRIPEYVGTLHGVTATGGSIIEVETTLVDDANLGQVRVTAWVTGARTGQELSSDLTYTSQPGGDGNSVYFAVQRADTGAFIAPPTRVSHASGAPTTSASNLRMVNAYAASGVLIAWRRSDGIVEFAVIKASLGSITATHQFAYVTQNCHRAFDVASGAADNFRGYFLFAFTSVDSGSSVAPAYLPAEVVSVNALGAATTIFAISDILAPSRTLINGSFVPWALRGVELDQGFSFNPATQILTIAFAARVVSRLVGAGPALTSKLDGQIIAGTLSSDMSVHAIHPVVVPNQVYVPFIGFQTKDDHSTVLASASGGSGVSGAASLAHMVLALAPGSVISNGTPVATATLSDGTQQTYLLQLATAYSPFVGSTVLGISSLSPYHATGSFEADIGVSGAYPTPVHTYAGGTTLQGTVSNRQVNWLDVTTRASGAGWGADGYVSGCTLKDGAGRSICTATVRIFSGRITELAIEDANIIDPGIATPPPSGVIHCQSITVPGRAPSTFSIDCVSILGNLGAPFSIVDIQDTTRNISSASYAHPSGLEMCVHRWSVAQSEDASTVVLALSSTSANTVTTPNGDEVYGAADPHAKNNFFEVYKYAPSVDSGPLLPVSAGVSSHLIAALGGPWRLVAGLCRINGRFFCSITPSGDEGQRNTFLVDVGAYTQTMQVSSPGMSPDFDRGASSYSYSDNIGMFVQSANMVRVTAPPLNTPTLRKTSTVMTAGGLRDGSTKGTQSVFALDYEDVPQNWRKMTVFSDYTFVNGGVPSVYDGVNVNEITSLVWPQADLTSINWPWKDQDVYVVDPSNTNPAAQTSQQPNAFWQYGVFSPYNYFLYNITRPYFKYEAGFLDKNGYVNPALGCGWSRITTRWGGDPSKNYETVYADPRTTQFSNQSGYGAFGVNGSQSFTHYYGRYQSFSSGLGGAGQPFNSGDTDIWVWAPRSAEGWDTKAQSAYSAAEAGGDFLMRWVYEYTDGTGRMVQSCPSNATRFTICAEIFGATRDSNMPKYAGGSVAVFQYGFFVPGLELTNRLTTSAADARRVNIQPYATAEPYSTVCYRMPTSSFSNSASDFVVGRGTSRAVVPHVGQAFSIGLAPLGMVTDNLKVFDGPLKDYNGIMSQPFLYTTGNVLDNMPPPSCKAMCIHQNRLVLGGADDPTVVWFSKPITDTDGPGFNDLLTIAIGDGGPVMGLASLNGNLIIFKEMDVYVVPGTLPDASGFGPSLGEPFNLPAGVGCIDHRSVIETPVGVFFRSLRGLELLTPALDVQPITKVRDTLLTYPNITSTAHYPENREVWFVCHDTLVSDATPTPQGVILVFNYQTQTWSTFRTPCKNAYLGTGPFSIALVGESIWLAGGSPQGAPVSQAYTYKYDPTIYYDRTIGSTKNWVKITVVTAPISLNEVQGCQRVKRVRLLGTTTGNYGPVSMGVWTDYSMSNVQQAVWTVPQLDTVLADQGRFQLEVHVAQQKGQKISVAIIEGSQSPVPGDGYGLAISNLALVVGLKAGLDKRITTEAKH